LQFLKRTHLYLSGALGGDPKLRGQLVQRKRYIYKPASLEDTTFAGIQGFERHTKRLSERIRLLAFAKLVLLLSKWQIRPSKLG
jgi:hypothetical protein